VSSEDVERALARAAALAQLRRLSECSEACRSALALVPSEPRALRLLAWSLFEAGECDAAERHARDLLSAHPMDLDARRILARAALRRGDTSSAVQHAQACAAHVESLAQDRARLARALAARVATDPECAGEARQSLYAALAAEPPEPRGWYDLLRAALALSDRAATEACAGGLLARAPDDPYFLGWIAFARLSIERDEDALALASAAIARAPNLSLSWRVKADALARLGRDAEAAEARREWLRLRSRVA
jgi:predicted Zn-dependent protease